MRGLVIVGAGGFGREVLQYARDAHALGRCPEPIGFVDDSPEALAGYDVGLPVLGGLASLGDLARHSFVVGVGEPGVRRRLVERIRVVGGELVSVIHPSAYVPPSARIGPGSVVAPMAVLAVDSRIDEDVVVNAYACVGHDSLIGAHSVLAPFSTTNGFAQVGDTCLLGTHSSVAMGVAVGRYSKVASGAVVQRDVPAGSLALGIPAASRPKYEVPEE